MNEVSRDTYITKALQQNGPNLVFTMLSLVDMPVLHVARGSYRHNPIPWNLNVPTRLFTCYL